MIFNDRWNKPARPSQTCEPGADRTNGYHWEALDRWSKTNTQQAINTKTNTHAQRQRWKALTFVIPPPSPACRTDAEKTASFF